MTAFSLTRPSPQILECSRCPKASSVGREGGAHSIAFYTDSKIVHVAFGGVHTPGFGAIS
ncbi:hypothetical protein ACFU53_46855 [Streptomyces sp. NPDC057474]|uniref:hypothetical protein n=1 Tax=Streptomyces sp. NPDC057474 TaxID=3346144 RepID=UPI0036B1FAB4